MPTEGSKIHFVQTAMLHSKSKVMKNRIQWCKTFVSGGGGGMSGGHQRSKSRIAGPLFIYFIYFLFFDCHTTPPGLFELEP